MLLLLSCHPERSRRISAKRCSFFSRVILSEVEGSPRSDALFVSFYSEAKNPDLFLTTHHLSPATNSSPPHSLLASPRPGPSSCDRNPSSCRGSESFFVSSRPESAEWRDPGVHLLRLALIGRGRRIVSDAP